jgi:hypothetical protein
MSSFRDPPRMTIPRGPGSIDPRWIGGLALLVILGAGLARGIYTVGPESVGVIQRFGPACGSSFPSGSTPSRSSRSSGN